MNRRDNWGPVLFIVGVLIALVVAATAVRFASLQDAGVAGRRATSDRGPGYTGQPFPTHEAARGPAWRTPASGRGFLAWRGATYSLQHRNPSGGSYSPL